MPLPTRPIVPQFRTRFRPMGLVLLAALAGAGLLCAGHETASAQSLVIAPPPPPPPTFGSNYQSAPGGAFDLGSTFLNRIGNQATYGFNAAQRANPEGGGAPGADGYPKWRTWLEGYATHSRQGAQGFFAGDKRRAVGGIAGLSVTPMQGVTVGVSVDQSHTKIDIPLSVQSATMNMTQLGLNVAFERGAWTAAFAVIRGFADIDAQRLDGATLATASYDARLTGGLAEISYYHGMGQARIVPKAAIEYLSIRSDPFSEIGGTNPVTASGQTASRTRLYLGAEVGHYWIVDQKIIDLSAYGKFVDNLQQNVGSVNVAYTSGIGTPVTMQGIAESQYGFNTGATLSVSFTQSIRAYLAYDGKFREDFSSHTGTAGLDIRW